MAIAAWLVWRNHPSTPAGDASRRRGLTLFVLQLALNALWTWLFFAWHSGASAFGEIIVLWLGVAITMRDFGRVRPVAAWLLAPYLVWVSFATALTWAMWRGNPGQL
jgi:tryptophan-rich sensory protein